MALALIGLGANVGDRAENLQGALRLLAEHSEIDLIRVGSMHETAPLSPTSEQPCYLNSAAVCDTSLEPDDLLAALKAAEKRLGRAHGAPWTARPIDLDLLLMGDIIRRDRDLTLPHPRMPWRRFVLAPAVEVAADWRHPLLGWTVREILAHLDETPPLFVLSGGSDEDRRRMADSLISRVSGHGATLKRISPSEGDAIDEALASGVGVLIDEPLPDGMRPKLRIVCATTSDGEALDRLETPTVHPAFVHEGLTLEDEAVAAVLGMMR